MLILLGVLFDFHLVMKIFSVFVIGHVKLLRRYLVGHLLKWWLHLLRLWLTFTLMSFNCLRLCRLLLFCRIIFVNQTALLLRKRLILLLLLIMMNILLLRYLIRLSGLISVIIPSFIDAVGVVAINGAVFYFIYTTKDHLKVDALGSCLFFVSNLSIVKLVEVW